MSNIIFYTQKFQNINAIIARLRQEHFEPLQIYEFICYLYKKFFNLRKVFLKTLYGWVKKNLGKSPRPWVLGSLAGPGQAGPGIWWFRQDVMAQKYREVRYFIFVRSVYGENFTRTENLVIPLRAGWSTFQMQHFWSLLDWNDLHMFAQKSCFFLIDMNQGRKLYVLLHLRLWDLSLKSRIKLN